MKLDWCGSKFRCVAEHGERYFMVYIANGVYRWSVARYTTDGGGNLLTEKDGPICGHDSIDDAKSQLERWLDEQDKPVWHDAGQHTSCAEWRGWSMLIRPTADSTSDIHASAVAVKPGINPQAVDGYFQSTAEAKAGIEAKVRKTGA